MKARRFSLSFCHAWCFPSAGVKAELAARIKGHYAGSGEAADVAEGAAEEVAEDAAADEDAAIEEVAEDVIQPAQAVAAAGKHQPIVFSEDIAKKMEAQKVVVEPVAQPATAVGGGDKLKSRAERFADPAVAKLKERAERFGLSHPELEKQKLLDRANKFGTLHPVVEEEKRKKRAERFNIVSDEQKKKMRCVALHALHVALLVGARCHTPTPMLCMDGGRDRSGSLSLHAEPAAARWFAHNRGWPQFHRPTPLCRHGAQHDRAALRVCCACSADKFKPLTASQPAASAKGISSTTTLGDADVNAKLEARKLRFQPSS